MNEVTSTSRRITLTETDDLLGALPCDLEGAPQRRFALLVFYDEEVHLRLLEDGASLVVGREPPAEIVVQDASVSRQHARVSRVRDRVWVEDLDSHNGTTLRGLRIQRERIEAGEQIGVGRARILLVATRIVEDRPRDCPADVENDLVLENPRMKQIYADVVRAARVDLPVLVLGETGTGKEHVAQAVHRGGDRRDKPFVVLNCGAVPASLLESTLFGHERGAFTGATARTIGVFERASGGVLFLDEIGELTAAAQVALLRAIETRRISRVGSSIEIAVDVRMVAATHCDLEGMIEEGTFRQDLFFRINGVTFEVPPLRERRDEIDPLVRLFLARARREWGARPCEVSAEAMDRLRRYAWPGNIRQLRNAVERAALVAASDAITSDCLPDYVVASAPQESDAPLARPFHEHLALKQQLRRYERALIEEALRRASGNRQAAAKLLRVPLRTLFRKMRAQGGDDEK